MIRKQHNITEQAGRSVLEMLAVLGVMGLITLAFITAYQYAWDRHRTNLIFAGLSAMAVSASNQLTIQKDFSLSEYIEEGQDKPYIQERYPISVGKKYKGIETDFSLTVGNVPKRICEFLVRANWVHPFETVVNEDGPCEEREDGNAVLFAFHERMNSSGTTITPGPEITPGECDSCKNWQSCRDNHCICDEGKLENLSFSECNAAGFNCSCSTGSDDTTCQHIQEKKCIVGQPSYQYGNS